MVFRQAGELKAAPKARRCAVARSASLDFDDLPKSRSAMRSMRGCRSSVSIFNRNEYLPEWESVPYPRPANEADEQERGFYERARKPIRWTKIDWSAFPEDGVFGKAREWLVERDIQFFASIEGEDLVLILNAWSGWPDPPGWGLATRRQGDADSPWTHWGHFSDLPKPWKAPGHKSRLKIPNLRR